jgi:translocation protein SEC63
VTPPVTQDSTAEDEISEPDEDSLAGQMAAMKGQPVKKRGDDSEDESATDDDDANGDTSDSDSD